MPIEAIAFAQSVPRLLAASGYGQYISLSIPLLSMLDHPPLCGPCKLCPFKMSSYKSSPPPPYSELDHCSYPSLFNSLKQSLVSLTMASSKIDLEVLPFDHVEMYGAPDKE